MLRVLFLTILMALPAAAQDRVGVERQFRGWLEQTVWPRAARQGVSRQTFDAAFDGVGLQWELPDLRPPGFPPPAETPQRQAEFGNPGKYFNRGSIDGATSVGRQMARSHASTLAAVERATGVPGRIILAIWGRESGYGRVDIPHDAFRVLGTKGFMSTRQDYFTDELIALLQIAEAGHAPEAAMRSSWAGALGQPQFMPSSFLNYAADGNGDGRADIWRSEADTIASIGTYLARHGWQPGRDWGFEVTVPQGVSCALEGPDQGRAIRDWAALGISRVGGKAFPENELNGEGYLLMPAGRHGPAFIVTPNFYVLKDYNMSDLYALFVGHVADRILGAGPLKTRWQTADRLTRGDVHRLQKQLVAKGHDVGTVDGLAGFRTRRSIGAMEQALGLPETCWPSKALAGRL